MRDVRLWDMLAGDWIINEIKALDKKEVFVRIEAEHVFYKESAYVETTIKQLRKAFTKFRDIDVDVTELHEYKNYFAPNQDGDNNYCPKCQNELSTREKSESECYSCGEKIEILFT